MEDDARSPGGLKPGYVTHWSMKTALRQSNALIRALSTLRMVAFVVPVTGIHKIDILPMDSAKCTPNERTLLLSGNLAGMKAPFSFDCPS